MSVTRLVHAPCIQSVDADEEDEDAHDAERDSSMLGVDICAALLSQTGQKNLFYPKTSFYGLSIGACHARPTC